MQNLSTDLDRLIAYSRVLGTKPQMIQAAGGNTSLISDGVMWIKASGRWLSDVDDKSSFCVYGFEPDTRRIRNPEATDADMRACVCNESVAVRASVEVAMHAAFPYRFVVHSHCVDVIAILIQQDAEQRLKMLGRARLGLCPLCEARSSTKSCSQQGCSDGQCDFFFQQTSV